MKRVALTALAAVASSSALADPDDVAAARASADAFQQHAGSAQQIQDNLTNPLLSQESMIAVDGTDFEAQLMCHEENAFMEVFIAPSGTGDVGQINIQYDTNSDGTFDALYSAPMHASGVCANGIVSCTPGTWSHCQPFEWAADDSNNLTLEPTGLNQLGGCYCVNNHCGSGLLVNNLDTTVAAIGGGAAAAIGANNAYYAITKVFVAGPIARYFGQDTTQCGAAGPVGMTAYVDNPTALTADAAAITSTDAVYDLVATSPAATQSDVSNVSCQINRSVYMDEVTIDDIIDYNGGTGAVAPCGPNCLQLILGQIGNNYWGPASCSMYEHNVEFNVLRPDRVVSARLTQAVWDDWIQVRANSSLIWSGPNTWTGMGNPPGSCELSNSWNQTMNVDFTSVLQAGGLVDFNIRVAVAGYGEGYAYAQVNVDTECELSDDIILDGCQAYQEDPDCSLRAETVDGVQTFQNYQGTGLSPLPSSITVTGAGCSEVVARDWWQKQRNYSCVTNSQYEFSEALERKSFIEESATPTAYSDQIIDPDTGSYVVTNGDMFLLDEVSVAACPQACKTRRPRARNDVGRSGVVSETSTSPATHDVLYHECTADNVCPLGDGEEIVRDCGCIEDFPEASAVMQLVRMAGQDVLCSSGTPQQLN